VKTRADADRMGLYLVMNNPGHEIGIIDTKDKMAAALILIGLKDRGLLTAFIGENGPRYYITPAGRAALPREAP